MPSPSSSQGPRIVVTTMGISAMKYEFMKKRSQVLQSHELKIIGFMEKTE